MIGTVLSAAIGVVLSLLALVVAWGIRGVALLLIGDGDEYEKRTVVIILIVAIFGAAAGVVFAPGVTA